MPWVEVIRVVLSIDFSKRLDAPQVLEAVQLAQLHNLCSNVQKSYENIHRTKSRFGLILEEKTSCNKAKSL